MRSTSGPLLLAAALAASCSAERSVPPPVPTAIEPAAAYHETEVPVVIRGEAFYLRAWHGAGGPGGDAVSAQFRGWLGAVELREVTWVDAGTLTAVVPARIPLGTHDLVVEGPYGTRGVLPAAYVAVDGPARLTVIPAAVPPAVLVGDPAEIRVQVWNVGGIPVEDVEVQLKPLAAPKSDVPGAPDPQVLEPGASFEAAFPVTTSVPGLFEFEAKASGKASAFVASAKVPVALEVVAGMRASAAVSPSPTPVGSRTTVTVTVVNGTPYALAASIAAVTTAGAEIANADMGTATALSAAGGSGQVVYGFDPIEAGTVELGIHVLATDGTHGYTVSVPVSIAVQ